MGCLRSLSVGLISFVIPGIKEGLFLGSYISLLLLLRWFYLFSVKLWLLGFWSGSTDLWVFSCEIGGLVTLLFYFYLF